MSNGTNLIVSSAQSLNAYGNTPVVECEVIDPKGDVYEAPRAQGAPISAAHRHQLQANLRNYVASTQISHDVNDWLSDFTRRQISKPMTQQVAVSQPMTQQIGQPTQTVRIVEKIRVTEIIR